MGNIELEMKLTDEILALSTQYAIPPVEVAKVAQMVARMLEDMAKGLSSGLAAARVHNVKFELNGQDSERVDAVMEKYLKGLVSSDDTSKTVRCVECGATVAVAETLGELEAQPVSPAQPHPRDEPGEPPAIAYALWDPRDREFCGLHEDRNAAHALAVNGLGVVEYWREQKPVQPQSRDESRDVWVWHNAIKELVCVSMAQRQLFDGCLTPQCDAGERYVPYSKLEAALADVSRLKAALNRDRTGLAAALVRVKELCAGYSWIPDGEWGSYDYTQQTKETLRKEVGNCLDAIHDVAMAALQASGDVAARAIRNEPSDSELLDAILEAHGEPDDVARAIKNAIAERAKRNGK